MLLKISSLTFPSTLISNTKYTKKIQEKSSQYFSFHPKMKARPHPKIQLHDQKYVSSFIHLNQVSSLSYISKSYCLLYPLKCNARDNSENTPEEGEKAMETVQKLYNALRNKNLVELSDIIGEECRCISNVATSLQTFYGKEQVIDFFNSIIKILKNNNFEFVIQPTIHDGTSVGVAWKLACSDTHVPVGKGFSFYRLNLYKGRIMIRNAEMLMEPLIHIEPVRLKITSFLLKAIQKMSPDLLKGKKKQAMSILFMVLLIAALLYLIKNSRNFM
ncbi:uncharacterized protein LOC132614296 [Lycium barbarum]|uniref:uncharacterized protein LOC132614296 n=1 Tax=Lycium barbarum TaxID=112863 RepID=UPI00293F5524|nr:uncharacterized protein LOC132614296 [Lycium barbarum]